MRRTTVYARNLGLGADTDLTQLEPIELAPGGYLGIQAQIDNGAGGAPTDAPLGTWELHVSSDGKTFAPFLTTSLTSALGPIAALGNTLVNGFAVVRGIPGTHAKLKYRRASGGGGTSRATVIVVSE